MSVGPIGNSNQIGRFKNIYYLFIGFQRVENQMLVANRPELNCIENDKYFLQAGKYVRANMNVPLEDPGYDDLKRYRRKVLKKLGMQHRLQKFERKYKVI